MSELRRPTLVDLAKEADCSTALASIVMRDAPGASAGTRRRVKEVARRIGYRTDQRARSLRQRRSNRIGVLFTVRNPFHSEVSEAIWRAAARKGYEIVLCLSEPGDSDIVGVEPLLGERCEAVIILGSTSTVQELEQLDQDTPIVVIGKKFKDPAVDTVGVDDRGAINLLMEHLFECGHRRIAHIDGDNSPSCEVRAETYRQKMEEHSLSEFKEILLGGWQVSDGERAARQMLERHGSESLPTAIVAFNDPVAIGAMNYLIRHGVQVPEQISIVGFDDSAAGASIVPLTSIAQSPSVLAELALDRAIARARGLASSEDSDQTIAPHLVVRESVRNLATAAE